MSEYDNDNPLVRYITYVNDDDDYYHITLFNKDRTIKKKKSFLTEESLQEYCRYSDLKDKYKEKTISEEEFKEYELYLRRRFINKHYDQFSKLNPYGRYKIITKMYNFKYHFNVSDDVFRAYLRYNFSL